MGRGLGQGWESIKTESAKDGFRRLSEVEDGVNDDALVAGFVEDGVGKSFHQPTTGGGPEGRADQGVPFDEFQRVINASGEAGSETLLKICELEVSLENLAFCPGKDEELSHRQGSSGVSSDRPRSWRFRDAARNAASSIR